MDRDHVQVVEQGIEDPSVVVLLPTDDQVLSNELGQIDGLGPMGGWVPKRRDQPKGIGEEEFQRQTRGIFVTW